MRNTFRRFRRGGAVLEAALVFPILLTLTFGSIEFGYFFYVKHTLQGAAREGARAAIVASATNASVTGDVDAVMQAAGFSSGQYTVSIRNGTDTADVTLTNVSSGESVLVKVSANWGTVGVSPLGVIASGKNIVGRSVMRKEG